MIWTIFWCLQKMLYSAASTVPPSTNQSDSAFRSFATEPVGQSINFGQENLSSLKYKLSISDITDAIAASLLQESQLLSLGHVHSCAVFSHSLTTDQYKPPCFSHRPIKAWSLERWIYTAKKTRFFARLKNWCTNTPLKWCLMLTLWFCKFWPHHQN